MKLDITMAFSKSLANRTKVSLEALDHVNRIADEIRLPKRLGTAHLVQLCLTGAFVFLVPEAFATPVDAKPNDQKRPTYSAPKDSPELPNVLLIGDSISIGYTAEVQQRLAEKADVFRIRGNAKYSEFGLQNLDKWIGTRKWDVIHFNWGLWDLCYRNPKSKTQGNRDKVDGTLTATPQQYRANLEKIVARLKKTGATLIWCTTTPVPEDEAGRKLGDDIRYNQIAEEIMKANQISINDLHSHAMLKLPEIQVRKGDVHFTADGYVHLAAKVAEEISAVLSQQQQK